MTKKTHKKPGYPQFRTKIIPKGFSVLSLGPFEGPEERIAFQTLLICCNKSNQTFILPVFLFRFTVYQAGLPLKKPAKKSQPKKAGLNHPKFGPKWLAFFLAFFKNMFFLVFLWLFFSISCFRGILTTVKP